MLVQLFYFIMGSCWQCHTILSLRVHYPPQFPKDKRKRWLHPLHTVLTLLLASWMWGFFLCPFCLPLLSHGQSLSMCAPCQFSHGGHYCRFPYFVRKTINHLVLESFHTPASYIWKFLQMVIPMDAFELIVFLVSFCRRGKVRISGWLWIKGWRQLACQW